MLRPQSTSLYINLAEVAVVKSDGSPVPVTVELSSVYYRDPPSEAYMYSGEACNDGIVDYSDTYCHTPSPRTRLATTLSLILTHV